MTPLILAAFAALPRSEWCGEGHPVPPLHIAPPAPPTRPDRAENMRRLQADRAERMRLYAAERDAQIRALRGQGVGVTATAAIVGCSHQTVWRALREAQPNGA